MTTLTDRIVRDYQQELDKQYQLVDELKAEVAALEPYAEGWHTASIRHVLRDPKTDRITGMVEEKRDEPLPAAEPPSLQQTARLLERPSSSSPQMLADEVDIPAASLVEQGRRSEMGQRMRQTVRQFERSAAR
jgi:hypothetical protein